MHHSFQIGDKTVGSDGSCFVIAEVGMAHDGSLGLAHSFIDAVANSGADAIKFQTHIAEAESTQKEGFRVKFSTQDKTRYAYWKRTEFEKDQWRKLAQHSSSRGLIFLSSPFSAEAVELLKDIGIYAWKIASGEVNNPTIFKSLAATELPVLISTGMSSIKEIDAAVDNVKAIGLPFAVLQCTSLYPCPPEKVGLNLIPFFKGRYRCAVGLSDHTGTIYAGLAAATLGADILEVHVTLSREMFGPDVPASITTTEMKELVEGVRFIKKMNSFPVEKDSLANEMTYLRDLFTKSLIVRKDLPAGMILKEDFLAARKPGTGIPANRISEIVGRRLKRAVNAGDMLKEDDLEVA